MEKLRVIILVLSCSIMFYALIMQIVENIMLCVPKKVKKKKVRMNQND